MSTWQQDPDGSPVQPLYPDGGVRGAFANRYMSGSQPIATGVRETLLFDTPIDNPVRIVYSAGTFTAPYAGRYDITAGIRWSTNGTGQRILYFMIGGVDAYVDHLGAFTGGPTTNHLAFTTYLNAGDVGAFSVLQNSGAALTVLGSPALVAAGVSISYAGA